MKNYPESAFKNEYKSVYVHQLSIAESQTQKGYGKKLMNEVYEMAKKNDIDLIELDYWCENIAAKEFYKKQDFKMYREFAFRQL
ncbi:GNAT family N-acetyltransferase [Peribacillus simplex]|uniref:GNAT family N-acetyltransferase n=1 Tax=Peribacillus simplex TaxID=1478 RepID=UPI0028535709|nr:GNAT family N-acetyltransferase [Peribacillus simplex]MDR4927905.1 GNAT family N-acetyltransferase [Peribacillus simplex]